MDRCIPTLLNQPAGVVGRILIVDNLSTDDTCKVIQTYATLDNRIILIKNKKNLGFSRANNIGLARCSAKFVLFLNPDTELSPGTLTSLLDSLKQNPRTGIIGPQLVFEDGKIQFGYGARPTVLTIMRDFLLSGRVRARLNRSQPVKTPQNVDWVSGACLLAYRHLLNKLGGFDENIFMYSEDVDLCLRAKAAGYDVVYNPLVSVIHFGGKSMKKNLSGAVLSNMRARLYFIKKYDGPIQAGFLWLFFLFYIFVRIFVHALLSFKKQQRRYLNAYAKVLYQYVTHQDYTGG